MEKSLIEIISELSDINVSEINLTSKFSELEFDYLDMAELIQTVEGKLRIDINNDMFYVETVNELIELINKSVSTKN